MFGQAAQYITAFATAAYSLKVAIGALTNVAVVNKAAIKAMSAASAAWNRVARFVTGTNTALGASGYAAAGGLSAAAMAMRALLVATGVGAAVAVLGAALDALCGSADKAGDATEKDTEAEEAYTRAAADAKAAIDGEIKKLAGLMKSHKDTKEAIDELNAKYGETFGNHATAAEWYDILTQKSALYAKQLGFEAQAKLAASKVAELEIRKEANADKQKELIKSGKATTTTGAGISVRGMAQGGMTVMTNEFKAAADEGRNISSELDYWNKNLDTATRKASDLAKEIGNAGVKGDKDNKGVKGDKDNKGVKGDKGDKGNKELKEIAGARSEKDIKSNIAYYEEMRSKVEGNAEAYAGWTRKILEARDALSTLAGIASHVEIERDFNGKLGRGKASDLLKGSDGGGLLPQADSDTVLDTEIKGLDELQKKIEETREKGVDAFGALKGAWNGVQGIGDGIRNITSAIESNGDAWSMITGIVNGAIQVFEGISGIVDIVKALTGATKEQTAAQQTDNAQKAEGIALSGAAAGATLTEAAAGEVKAGANASEAISGAAKEGAKLAFPYNLIAIAAGVAAVVSALAMMSSFATGGIVGGSSTTGDKVLARVNSGEMILNRRQQENLLRILSSRQAVPVFSSVRAGGITGQDVSIDMGSLRSSLYAPTTRIEVTGRLRGKDLHLSQKNYEAVHGV